MARWTTILGIETSCDETAAAVVVGAREVRSNVVASQIDLHRKYGGVVPEIAARSHLEQLDSIIHEALAQAGCTLQDIDAVAVSNRPGLVGCLLIGITAAKSLAWVLGKPLIPVNHVHAHVTSPAMVSAEPPWPAVALVVSGGHTSLYHVDSPTAISLMGCTIDDAAGEAFDKVSAILQLGYPGGPAIQRAAEGGDPRVADFPRSLLARDSLDFSFSGIKTAVLYHVHGVGQTSGGLARMSQADVSNVAATFQEAVVDVLVTKVQRAVDHSGVRTVLAGGGVVANRRLRERLEALCMEQDIALHLAPLKYCTDNGAMIAAHAYWLAEAGITSTLVFDAASRETHETAYTSS